MPRRMRWVLPGAAAIVLAAALLWACFGTRGASSSTGLDARYVGSASCQSCHSTEFDAWTGSQHQQAMQEARPDSALGDFDEATFTDAGVTSTFFRRGQTLFARTDEPDGRLADFPIKYTFGVSPLQQYLVEVPDGRIQALSIAWNTRPANQGGQRWFHRHPDERIDHTDELHWTGGQQNWNYMCADCHSTNVRKNHDAEHDTFATAWSEISVGGEAWA